MPLPTKFLNPAHSIVATDTQYHLYEGVLNALCCYACVDNCFMCLQLFLCSKPTYQAWVLLPSPLPSQVAATLPGMLCEGAGSLLACQHAHVMTVTFFVGIISFAVCRPQ